MFCSHCGKEIPDSARFCPECSAEVSASQTPAPAENPVHATQPKQNTLCLIGFVIALISLLLNFWGIVGIAATIISVLGLQQAKSSGQKGAGIAITGICIGVFSILYGVIAIISLM